MNDPLIVLDIGKTQAKLAPVEAAGKVLGDERLSNAIPTDGPYPQHGIDDVWTWMLAACRGLAQLTPVSEDVRLFCASWPTCATYVLPVAMHLKLTSRPAIRLALAALMCPATSVMSRPALICRSPDAMIEAWFDGAV